MQTKTTGTNGSSHKAIMQNTAKRVLDRSLKLPPGAASPGDALRGPMRATAPTESGKIAVARSKRLNPNDQQNRVVDARMTR